MYGPDGRPVPRNQWPNQGPTTPPAEIRRRQEEQARANAIANLYGGQIRDGIATFDEQRAGMLLNFDARNRAFGNQEGAIRRNTLNDIAEARLNLEGYNVQQRNFPQWYSFLDRNFWNEAARNVANQEYVGQQQVNSANERLYDWQEITNNRRTVRDGARNARRDALSAATVSGVVQNAEQDWGDIALEERDALAGLDIADSRSKLAETRRRQQLSNQRKGLEADLRGLDLSTREQRARLREREQLLDLEARKAGLKPAQLLSQMEIALSNLGLDRAMSTGQFLESMNSLNAQQRQMVNQYMGQQWFATQAARGG